MKKHFEKLMLPLLGCVSFLVAGCGSTPEPNYSVTLSNEQLDIEIGSSDTKLEIGSVTKDGNAFTDYTLTWSSADEAIATVNSSGYVTAVSAGITNINANITMNDTQKVVTASCSVTVYKLMTLSETNVVLNLKTTDSIYLTCAFEGTPVADVTYSTLDSSIADVTSYGKVTGLTVGKTKICAVRDSDPTCKAFCDVEVIDVAASITGITVDPSNPTIDANGSHTVQLTATVSGPGDFDRSVMWSSLDSNIARVDSNGLVTAISNGSVSIYAVARLDYSMKAYAVINVIDTTPVSISLDKTTAEVTQNGSLQLNATLAHAANKEVTWTSDTDGIRVIDGVVGVEEATAVGTKGIITATSVQDPTKSATCEITVTKPTYKYDYTFMLYMSASNLENDGTKSDMVVPGLMSYNLEKFLVPDIPDNVKVIIETGGTTKWGFKSNNLDGATEIDAKHLQRWEVTNHKLHLVETLNTNKLALTSSFEDFLSWGLKNYDAKHMSVTINSHGGALAGCCYDDNYPNSDGFSSTINTPEFITASKNALAKNNRNKFNWIGFDCCLMQCADIASVACDYYDYMLASQESEIANIGWAYDEIISKIVAKPSIKISSLLTTICTKFVNSTHSVFCDPSEPCNQTLSVLDLSKMNTFTTAFNAYVAETGFSYTEYKKYENAFKSSYTVFGDACYGLCDFKDYLKFLAIEFDSVSTDDVLSALDELIVNNSYCSRYSVKPCGLNAFFPLSLSKDFPMQARVEDYTGPLATRFTDYQNMCLTYGTYFG